MIRIIFAAALVASMVTGGAGIAERAAFARVAALFSIVNGG